MTSTEHLGAFIVIAIMCGLMTFVGLALYVLPGLIAIFFHQFAPLASLDTGEGVGAAIGRSAKMAQDNAVPCFLLFLINGAAAWLGGILFGILTLLLPISTLVTVHVYRQASGQAVAP